MNVYCSLLEFQRYSCTSFLPYDMVIKTQTVKKKDVTNVWPISDFTTLCISSHPFLFTFQERKKRNYDTGGYNCAMLHKDQVQSDSFPTSERFTH